MELDFIDRVVRSLIVGLTNGMLYFPKHRRVVEACTDTVEALATHFEHHHIFMLGLREGMLIFEGKPLFDLSLYAHKLIEALQDRQAHGLQIERGVSHEEIQHLLAMLLDAKKQSVEEINISLSTGRITRVKLLEKPVGDRISSVVEEEQRFAIDDQKVSREVYSEALSSLQDVMVQLRRDRKASIQNVQEAAQRLAGIVPDNKIPLIALTAAKDYDTFTFNHSVNVCIYATALAETLTTDADEVVRIAQAALLHDIGKILIPEKVLYKPGKLSEQEWNAMRQHPALGAKILMTAGDASDLAVNVAFGHHLRYDRKGYPELSRDVVVDPVTELINVIDVYEAVTAVRPYKTAFAPERAAELLIQGAGTEFNPACVEAFIGHFGIYPVGCHVRLNDGSEGQVIQANPSAPFRPNVRILRDPRGKPLKRPRVVDLAGRHGQRGFEHAIVASIPQQELRTVQVAD